MRALFLLAATLIMTPAVQAKVIMKEVTYKDGDTVLKGTLVYDDKLDQTRPGVLLVPEWWGHNDYIKRRAREMASLGYVAFAVDMYGDSKTTDDPKQAEKWASPFYKDGALMLRRAQAGLNVLRSQPHVDKDRVAAIGFCFGGSVALNLARQGEDIKGVGAFHAGLKFPDDAKTGSIKAKILVMNGAADPMVPAADRQKFIDEMQKAGADLQFNEYGGAVHAFTNPDADKLKMDGVAYNEKAEKRSFAALKQFFNEIFAK